MPATIEHLTRAGFHVEREPQDREAYRVRQGRKVHGVGFTRLDDALAWLNEALIEQEWEYTG